MRTVSFAEANEIVGEEPVTIQVRYTTDRTQGTSYAHVWRLTWYERIWLLCTGRLYVATQSSVVVPQVMSVVKDHIIPRDSIRREAVPGADDS